MAGRAALVVGSWAELGSRIQRLVSENGLNLHEAGRRGLRDVQDGPPSSQALVRTFGKDESEIRVRLYRDNHAWCPYCHKVWMQLEEKRIPYRVEKINMNCYGDKKRSFLAKTSRGLLPAIEIDGNFQVESSKIMMLIEESFPEYRPMLPAHGPQKALATNLLSLERNVFGAWLNWLRGEESSAARAELETALDMTDKALERSGGPYFLGQETSLVDCVFASSLERIAASILYYKGLRVKGGRWAHINSWFSAMERLESYQASRSDFHTHVHDLPPQIGGCIASNTPEQIQIAAAIDGSDGHSWCLPLPPLTPSYLEPGVENPLADRLEAANALVHCHTGVLRSCRGDDGADLAFRCVAQALINGVDQALPAMNPGMASSAAQCLRYTRDRISVPRDMSFPAARQLRAHLNWVADSIDPHDSWQGIRLPVQNRRDTDPAIFAGL